MATTRTLMAWLASSIALLAQLQPVLAEFWTITQYEVEFLSSRKANIECTATNCVYYTYSSTITLAPQITPTATPTSSTTYTNTWSDAVEVTLYLPASAVPSSELIANTRSASESYISTHFAIPVTYTAPASCPTPFTFSTDIHPNIYPKVGPHINGFSTATTVFGSQSTPAVVVFLPTTAVPSSMLSPTLAISLQIQICRNPSVTHRVGGNTPTTTTTTTSSHPKTNLPSWIIPLALLPPLLLLLGLLESYLWFRCLMLGQSALRVGTVCWCLLCFWVICLTRRAPSRSVADQKLLRAYWGTLSAGTRFRLWRKWGFRWKYPAELLGELPRDSAVPVGGPVTQQRRPPAGPSGGGFGGVGEKQQAAVGMNGVESYMGQQGQAYAVVMQPGQPGVDPNAPLPPGYVYMPVYMGQQQPGQGLGSTPDGGAGQRQGQQGQHGQQPPH